jgi:hypothetical protein
MAKSPDKPVGPALLRTAVPSLLILLALDIGALRVLEQGWGIAGGVGAGAAVVLTLLAFVVLDNGLANTREVLMRLAFLVVLAAVFVVAIHFIFALALLPTIAIGLAIAIIGLFALLIATGNV